MDKFERKQILEEFLIKWKTGKSLRTAEEYLDGKYNPLDVKECKRIFDKWLRSKKAWKYIGQIT